MTEQTAVAIAESTAPPVLQEPGSLLPAIMKIACDPSLDVTKLDALLKMQAELEERQARREAIEAFTRVAAQMPRVKKNGTIDLGNKGGIPFAKWEDMDEIIRPIITAEGFSLSFDSPERTDGKMIITAHLLHRSGQVRSASTPPMPADTGPGRNALQAVGSTVSYGKRYAAEMLLNIVREGEDSDGTKAAQGFITAEEAAELRDLIAKTETDELRFCKVFAVEALEELPAANIVAAKNMLAIKLGKAR